MLQVSAFVCHAGQEAVGSGLVSHNSSDKHHSGWQKPSALLLKRLQLSAAKTVTVYELLRADRKTKMQAKSLACGLKSFQDRSEAHVTCWFALLRCNNFAAFP